VVVVLAIVGAIFFLEGQKADISENVVGGMISDDLKDDKYPKAPELAGIVEYLNTNGEEINIRDLEGKVVLIDFWTYTCINCIRTFPYLTDWDDKYKDKGLVIIGVHTPEFEFEKKAENVLNAMEKNNIEYPVVLDNDYATWRAYENRFWPRKYLIDSEGYIRYDHAGEGAYEETEEKIKELLSEIGENTDNIGITEREAFERVRTTPELYAGYTFALSRGQNLGNPSGFVPDEVVQYIISGDTITPDIIYMAGNWRNNPDDLELVGPKGSVIMAFVAKEVNLVASPRDRALELEVTINGVHVTREQAGSDVRFVGPRSYILVNEPRIYNVIDGEYGGYILGLGAEEGFSFNAFTFG